jgi:Domain of unknown function (DUF5655)/Domain of unknown function (DUF4287)
MAKSSQELEKEFLDTIVEQTGHDLSTWMRLISDSGETKTNAIINHIKTTYGLNHLQANLLTGIFLNDGKPVYDYEGMFNKLFQGLEHQLPLFREIETVIKANIPDVNMYPTKTYISLDGERCFGTVKINKTNIRVGLDLGNRPFDDYVQQAKSLGAMPRISHMIELHETEDVNESLLQNLQEAFHNVHG